MHYPALSLWAAYGIPQLLQFPHMHYHQTELDNTPAPKYVIERAGAEFSTKSHPSVALNRLRPSNTSR